MPVIVNRYTGETQRMSEEDLRLRLKAQGKSDESIQLTLRAILDGDMPEGEHEWYRNERL